MERLHGIVAFKLKGGASKVRGSPGKPVPENRQQRTDPLFAQLKGFAADTIAETRRDAHWQKALKGASFGCKIIRIQSASNGLAWQGQTSREQAKRSGHDGLELFGHAPSCRGLSKSLEAG